jgi:twinkle protein
MEISRKPCPNPGCSSSDAFSYNTEKKQGWCFSCGQRYPQRGIVYPQEVLEEFPIGRSVIEEEDSTMMNNQNVAVLPTPVVNKQYRENRGITKATMTKYGVLTEINHLGEEVAHEYPYPGGDIKRRLFPKTFTTTKGGTVAEELFGMNLFNAGSAKYVTICEGELDAMSAFQMLGSKYPVVSLSSATPNKKLLTNVKDWLSSFEKIYLSFDSDGKADHIAQKLVNLFPNKVYKVPHDKYKDANEFLQANATQEYRNAWFSSSKYVPDDVLNSTSDFVTLFKESDDPIYLETGIQALDEQILGLMQGHFTVFTAPEGIGKTEFMRYLEYHILSNHPGVPIAICHLEETPKRSLLGLVSYDLGLNLTRKELVYEHNMEKDVLDSIEKLTKDENLYQFSIGVDEDPISILDKIRWFAEASECKFVFFEPIQDLAYSRQMDGTVEQFLSELSTKLARLSAELNIGIVTIAHENDDGNIRDCRMIGKRASVVVKLERDKMNEDPVVRNTTTLLVTKNRPAGNTGRGGHLFFDADSFTLSEA